MKRLRSMQWLFQAGIVGAKRQLLAIIVVTLTLGLLSKLGLTDPLVAPSSSGRLEVTPALTWTYLLLAAAMAILPKVVVDRTAARMRLIARHYSPSNPRKFSDELRAMLWLAAISDGVLTVVPPPAILLIISGSILSPAAGALGWAAVMSVGAAYFGANAMASR